MMKQRQRPKIQSETLHCRLSKDSDDSGEEVELFAKKHQFQEATIEKVIEEGDTLQSLSLQYHCSISELKRLNNIHRENEIYAKRTIKVPLRPFSMSIASVHISGTTTPVDNINLEPRILDPNSLQTKLTEKINIPHSGSTNGSIEVNQIIFNSDLKPVVSKGCDSIIDNEISEDEHVQLLQGISSIPIAETVVTRLSFNGADADISWIALIACAVIVIFAIPLIYVFYIAEHPEHYHHEHLT